MQDNNVVHNPLPVDDKGRVQVEHMTDTEMLRELVTTTRTIADALEAFDPTALLGVFMGGNNADNPLGAIMGAFVRQ